jgi:hypothetical protein
LRCPFSEEAVTNVLAMHNDEILYGDSNGLLNLDNGNVEKVQHLECMPSGTIDANEGEMFNLKSLNMIEGQVGVTNEDW